MSSVEAAARSDDSFDYLFKVVLIGDSSVGKTCIVQRFKHGTYVEKHGNTIGVDFTIKTVNVDGKRVKVTNLRAEPKLAVVCVRVRIRPRQRYALDCRLVTYTCACT